MKSTALRALSQPPHSISQAAFARIIRIMFMNELLFGIHAALLVAIVFLALHMGKEALIALFSVQMILANLFVTKQMECFGATVTCSDVYAMGALLCLNVLQEYFGRRKARQAIWISLMASLVFVLMGWIHKNYLPSAFDTTQAAFETLLGQTPRIVLASLIVSFVADRLDMRLYTYAKKSFFKKSFAIRFFGAACITQLFDTVAFSFLGLYGLVHSVGAIICLSYAIKILVIATMAPLTALSKKWTQIEPIS